MGQCYPRLSALLSKVHEDVVIIWRDIGTVFLGIHKIGWSVRICNYNFNILAKNSHHIVCRVPKIRINVNTVWPTFAVAFSFSANTLLQILKSTFYIIIFL